MKCQFPRFEQSEGSFSNTLADAVMNWNPTTVSFENFAKAKDSFIFTMPKCPEFKVYDAFTS